MLLERIIPTTSSLYKEWQAYFSFLGQKIDAQGWIQLFTIWTLTVAGIVVSMDFTDRYVYWEWDGWQIGLLKLIFVSIIFFYFLRPKQIWLVGVSRLNIKQILIHGLIAFLLLLIGYLDTSIQSKISSMNWSNVAASFAFLLYLLNIFSLLPYVLVFLSCLLVFQFTIELNESKGTWVDSQWENKFEYLSVSVILMVLAVCTGIYYKDPVISTAGAVATPFAAIALIWPSHVRHLQRARFYPLFIFAMFISVRAPWFLIPLAVLFFVLRTVNYFRYGIVHPSFGVDLLEEE